MPGERTVLPSLAMYDEIQPPNLPAEAVATRKRATELFRTGQYSKARDEYERAIRILDPRDEQSSRVALHSTLIDLRWRVLVELMALFNNHAQCSIKLEETEKVNDYAGESLG